MIAHIFCSVCSEELGTIDKHEITDEDRLLYSLSVVCSNGHGGSESSSDIDLNIEEEA